MTALFAALPAVVLGVMYLRGVDATRTSPNGSVRLEKQQADLASATRAATAAPLAELGRRRTAAAAGPLAIEYVPYGERRSRVRRLERLRTLTGTLEAQGFQRQDRRRRVSSAISVSRAVQEATGMRSPSRRRRCRSAT